MYVCAAGALKGTYVENKGTFVAIFNNGQYNRGNYCNEYRKGGVRKTPFIKVELCEWISNTRLKIKTKISHGEGNNDNKKTCICIFL